MKDGPRADAYRAAKEKAWEAARAALDQEDACTCGALSRHDHLAGCPLEKVSDIANRGLAESAESSEPCPACRGTGWHPLGTAKVVPSGAKPDLLNSCPTCKGSGKLTKPLEEGFKRHPMSSLPITADRETAERLGLQVEPPSEEA